LVDGSAPPFEDAPQGLLSDGAHASVHVTGGDDLGGVGAEDVLGPLFRVGNTGGDLAGHLLIPEVPCVLKVRAIADMDERMALLQQERKITRDEATAHITRQDRHRALWTRYLYRVDIDDPRLYDVIIHTGNLTIGDACEIICCAARSETYQVTSESERVINDLAIVSHIKAALQTTCDADVVSNDGLVRVSMSAQKIKRTGMISPRLQMHVQEQIREDLTKEILKIAQAVPGVKEVVCNVELPYYA